MSVIDIEQLLQPVGEEAPCGADLTYDDRFFAVENAAKGKEPSFLGEQEIPGDPPDYKAVRDGCLELLKETRDLRLAVMLATAELAMEGIGGFHRGLQLTHGLIDRHWEKLFPELDADDPDPVERTNTLAALNDKSPNGVIGLLRTAPLTGRSSYGEFTLRDYEIITGVIETPASEEEPPTMSAFSSAMDSTSTEQLKATAAAIKGAQETAQAIEKAFSERSGGNGYISLEPMRDTLAACLRCVNESLERRGGGEGEAEGDAGEAGAGGGGGQRSQALPGSVGSREQAAKAIDLAIAYFERHEPSHPAPLLLRRAQGLINRPFLDVIDELFKVDSDIPRDVRRKLGLPLEDE